MRRWILLILLLVLPFQAVWAGTTRYCGHEAGPAVAHFGHHEHQHRSGTHDGQSTTAAADDVDCATCHLSAPGTIPSGLNVFQPRAMVEQLAYREPLYASYTPSGPERPDISGCRAAVRSGGGAPDPSSLI